MPYEIIPHTADVRLRASGKTSEELFSEALKGMMTIAKPAVKNSTESTRRHIGIASFDQTALLIDFLNEALSLSQIHKEAYMVVRFSSFSETELEGELEGKPAVFGEDIKAVTYHGAEIIKSNSGDYEVTILFDI